jgi:pyruvate/2-oxoglutarate dehydrogenase complex dihydrolipoamide acyltransferase (E2) component
MNPASEALQAVARIIVERESVNDDSVVVTRLVATDGAMVLKGQVVLEVETSKTASEVVAPIGGRVLLRVSVGNELKIGEVLFEVEPEGSESSTSGRQDCGQINPDTPPAGEPDKSPILSLAARRAAHAHGIGHDLFARAGWVTAADVLAVAGAGATASTARLPEPTPVIPSSAVASAGTLPTSLESLSKRKLHEIRNLAIGNSHGSTSTIGASLIVRGPRLVRPPALFRDTIADLIVYEGARLLRKLPRLNAFWADERRVALYQCVNFGVTFDSGDNLKVLAIRAADTLGLDEIHREFSRLLDLYESGARIDDELLASATVTLSDLSGMPVSFMHPLVNGRQALILGVTRPTAQRYDVFASFDHRVSEGLTVARFLSELSQRVCSHFHERNVGRELSCSACRKPMEEELRLGGRGLLDVTLEDGSKGLLCRNCFMGY